MNIPTEVTIIIVLLLAALAITGLTQLFKRMNMGKKKNDILDIASTTEKELPALVSEAMEIARGLHAVKYAKADLTEKQKRWVRYIAMNSKLTLDGVVEVVQSKCKTARDVEEYLLGWQVRVYNQKRKDARS